MSAAVRTVGATDAKPASGEHAVLIGLSAAIVEVSQETPRVLLVHRSDGGDGLPFGNFDPLSHRTLESGLRDWVQEQTHLQLGYVEQLYTFGDRGRHLNQPGEGARVVSVGYLALTRTPQQPRGVTWRDWYSYFPWEDWRDSVPAVIASVIVPRLKIFADSAPHADLRESRRDRIRQCFGTDGAGWDEEKVLERYELLYEAGLVTEAQRDPGAFPPSFASGKKFCANGRHPVCVTARDETYVRCLDVMLDQSILPLPGWLRPFFMQRICSSRA